MKIGVQIPNDSAKASEIGLTNMGRLAEDAGADSLWVNDHLLTVEGGRSPYPFTPDGAIPWPMDSPRYECLTAASFLAATTSGCACPCRRAPHDDTRSTYSRPSASLT